MTTSLDRFIHRSVLFNHPFFKTKADDKLKWLPFGFLLVSDVFGAETASSWKKQVLITAAAESFRYVLSDTIKKMTQQHRPFPYMGNHSLPSGHTATAFSAAEIFRMEVKDSLPVLSYSGYLAATTVAVIRVMKNRHWLKDVLVGAAIGVVSTQLAYALVRKLSKRSTGRKVEEEKKIATESYPF